MSNPELFRRLYEHEKDSNAKMLDMLASVPEASRTDPRFQRAVSIAGHLAACRENWLDHIAGDSLNQVDWFPEECALSSLRPRYATLEAQWTAYLGALTAEQLAQDFSFLENGSTFNLQTEIQVMQLVGHASYHRGQVVILVDQLGGETVDTDYVYWCIGE